ncbi:hypothetical protein FPV67DRAFT_1451595 [Lyophyllum atratum]|nr:hypothetical protein FPV67DRAFT_1451595 [Lyophyllum atratum]
METVIRGCVVVLGLIRLGKCCGPHLQPSFSAGSVVRVSATCSAWVPIHYRQRVLGTPYSSTRCDVIAQRKRQGRRLEGLEERRNQHTLSPLTMTPKPLRHYSFLHSFIHSQPISQGPSLREKGKEAQHAQSERVEPSKFQRANGIRRKTRKPEARETPHRSRVCTIDKEPAFGHNTHTPPHTKSPVAVALAEAAHSEEATRARPVGDTATSTTYHDLQHSRQDVDVICELGPTRSPNKFKFEVKIDGVGEPRKEALVAPSTEQSHLRGSGAGTCRSSTTLQQRVPGGEAGRERVPLAAKTMCNLQLRLKREEKVESNPSGWRGGGTGMGGSSGGKEEKKYILPFPCAKFNGRMPISYRSRTIPVSTIDPQRRCIDLQE